MFKRLTAFLLAFLMVFAMVACNGESEETTAADIVTTEEITEKVEIPVDLTADILAEYIIVRPEKVKNESIDVTLTATKALKEALNTSFGLDLKLSDDWYKTADGLPETAKEILVGKTNRVETANALAKIRAKDFIIAFENERIVITAGNDNSMIDAVNYFIEKYVNTADKKITLYENHLEIVEYQYPMGSISIAGTPINEYKIVYPKGCDLVTYYTAVAMSDYLYDNAGVKLEVVDDSTAATDCEILVGATNRAESNIGIDLGTDKYSLSISGKKVVLAGDHRMVAGAAGVLFDHFNNGGKAVDVTNLPTAPAAASYTFKKATSGIMMIGDGMSRVHFDAAIDTKVITEFVADTLPIQAECTTASYSVLYSGKAYTDSAASATAPSFQSPSQRSVPGLLPRTAANASTIRSPQGPAKINGSRRETAAIRNEVNSLIKSLSICFSRYSASNSAAYRSCLAGFDGITMVYSSILPSCKDSAKRAKIPDKNSITNILFIFHL